MSLGNPPLGVRAAGLALETPRRLASRLCIPSPKRDGGAAGNITPWLGALKPIGLWQDCQVSRPLHLPTLHPEPKTGSTVLAKTRFGRGTHAGVVKAKGPC